MSARTAASRDSLAEAVADLADDLDALAWLAGAGRDRLDRLGEELAAVGRHLPGRTFAWMETERRRLRARQAAHARRLERLRDEARGAAPGERLRAQLAQAKAAHADLLRAERAALAALVVAADWQSPSFGHAVRPAAGRRAGAIVPHVDDYTRDRHGDAAEFEAAWVAEHGVAARALLTSCGMAAVTTVLGWLGPLARGALLGRGVYHETRDLIRGTTVDETDTTALLAAIDARRPSLVVLDTIGNAAGMPAPDLDAVIAHLRDREDVTLLIDNTACSMAWTPPPAGDLRLVVIESLVKHGQLGLDRAPAGLILASGPGTEALDVWREHLGTNVTDYAAVALPPPNRDVLLRRLRRLERNASLLAARLPGAAHPSRPDHHAFGRPLPFRGSFLTLQTAEPERFVAAAIERARAARVPLHAGTSFGLDVTRVYAPAGVAPAFARVAVGTEDRVAVDRVADALAAAARDVPRRPRPRGGSPPTPLATLRVRVHGRPRTLRLKLEGARGGSIKARTARALVEDLEARSLLAPGCELVESSSGNLGVALAQEAKRRGLSITVVVDPRTPPPLLDAILTLGARIESVDAPDPDGGWVGARIARVVALCAARPDLVWTRQYTSPANARAHELGTGPELLGQHAEPGAVVVPVSTGGTLAGLSRCLRHAAPATRVLAVDVAGSAALGGPARPLHLTGIGSGRRSELLDPGAFDDAIVVSEVEAVAACHALRRVGVAVGGSSGAAVAAALRWLAAEGEHDEAVCLCPDGAAAYRRTLYDRRWLAARGWDVEGRWPAGVEEVRLA